MINIIQYKNRNKHNMQLIYLDSEFDFYVLRGSRTFKVLLIYLFHTNTYCSFNYYL